MTTLNNPLPWSTNNAIFHVTDTLLCQQPMSLLKLVPCPFNMNLRDINNLYQYLELILSIY